jgi:hypothetical protein
VLDAAEGFVPPDPPELPLALAHVTEVGSRERTRIVCVYGLSEQLDGAERRLGVADLYPFGRFWPHVRAAAELLPNPVLSVREVDIELPGGGRTSDRRGPSSWSPPAVTRPWSSTPK